MVSNASFRNLRLVKTDGGVSEPRVKALSTTKLENKTHSPALTGISDADLQKIISFIKQP